MSAVEAARGKLSYLPFVARAAIAALREFPQLNATLEGDRLTCTRRCNLGIAVALGDDGLIVPVVHERARALARGPGRPDRGPGRAGARPSG